jgi:hypothetical protein
MSGYRDDRQVLRDQLDELTRELAEWRARGAGGARENEFVGLRARVEELGVQFDRDRQALAALARELAAIGPRANKPPTSSASSSGVPLGPPIMLLAVAVVGLGVVIIMMFSVIVAR